MSVQLQISHSRESKIMIICTISNPLLLLLAFRPFHKTTFFSTSLIKANLSPGSQITIGFKQNHPRPQAVIGTPLPIRPSGNGAYNTFHATSLIQIFWHLHPFPFLLHNHWNLFSFFNLKALEKVCYRFIARVDLLVEGRTPLGGGGVPEGGT